MLRKVNRIISYTAPVLTLFVIVQATISWYHFHDIVSDTWSTFALYGGMTPHGYGSVHLPLLHTVQHFLIKMYIDIGVSLGHDVGAVLNMYTIPISEVSKILHQLVFTPTIPLNLLILMKNVMFIINVLMAFLIARLAQKIGSEKRCIADVLFLLTLFNPVIFCVFFVLVKIDEALSLLGVVGVIYLLSKREGNNLKTSILDAILIGILSTFPLLSKIYFPAFSLLSSFIYYKISEHQVKGAIAVFLGALLVAIPLIPDLIQWYEISKVTGLTTFLHPGFYTLFSLARLGGFSYTEHVTMSLGILLSTVRPLLLMLIGLYAVILSASILMGKTTQKKEYLIALLNYLIFETGIRLLLVPNVLIQYLPMPIILFTLHLLLQDRIKLKFFLFYLILTIVSSASFIIYEWYNFFLGCTVFHHNFDDNLFLKTNNFMSGSYWDTSFQLILTPSYIAGFALWFIPLLMSALSISNSLKRLSKAKPFDLAEVNGASRNIRKSLVCIALILVSLSPVYTYLFTRYKPPTPYNVPTKTIIISSEANPICTFSVPSFPSIKYTITVLPENVLHNMSIRVIKAPSYEIYGSFSRALFQFMAYVDVPNQLKRFGIYNITDSDNLTKVTILYSDTKSNITHIVEKFLEDSQIVITTGPCEYKIEDLIVMSRSEQVLSKQIGGWRSIVVTLYTIDAGSNEIIYNDEILTVINLKNGKTIGILKTAIRLPSIPFAKSISEDICRTILKIISLLKRNCVYQTEIKLSDSDMVIIPKYNFSEAKIVLIDQEPVWWFPVTYVGVLRV